MTYIKPSETFYDILKVPSKATISEIVAAYHTAKNAFSKDSIATYSLFNNEEAQKMLNRLEEAYLTLSNVEKRAEYDKKLAADNPPEEAPAMTELEFKRNAQQRPATEESENAAILKEIANEPLRTVDQLTGPALKEIREKRGLSVEDVARITKIPTRFIKALEVGEVKQLPARVYVQGFLKNLASLYRLEPQSALKAYLANLEPNALPTENS